MKTSSPSSTNGEKKIPLYIKKKMIVQRGGFLPLLMGPLLKAVAAPILGTFVGNLGSVVGNLLKPTQG